MLFSGDTWTATSYYIAPVTDKKPDAAQRLPQP
jgi:hypothetical protein